MMVSMLNPWYGSDWWVTKRSEDIGGDQFAEVVVLYG